MTFRRTVLDYFGEMETRLSHALLRAFALALELKEDYFLASFRKPQTQLSLLHYPPQPPAAPEDEYGIRPHADATAFTILYQDEVGGLQVQGHDGGWIAATPIQGTYVINIGDMMARWTNDRFASTKHRVFNHAVRSVTRCRSSVFPTTMRWWVVCPRAKAPIIRRNIRR